MSKRKKKKKSGSFLSLFDNLNEETIHAVWGVIFFVLMLFFLFAANESAGIVGTTTFKMLVLLLGIGYYLLPLLSFILAISFFRSIHKKLGILKVIGSILFFLSGLGLINLIFPDRGGLIGAVITKPLVALFDVYFSLFTLGALLIISLLVLFNTSLPSFSLSFLKNIVRRKSSEEEYDDEYEEEEGEYEEEEEEVDGDETDDYEEIEEEEEEKINKTSPIQKILQIKERRAKRQALFEDAVGEDTYTPPPLSLLEKDKGKPGVGDIKANANIIKRTLQNFGIPVEIDEISIGPTVTRYALKPAEGVKLSKIIGLQNNLELALAAHPVRIEAPIPGRSLVGVEVPNTSKATVGLGTLLGTESFQASDKPLHVVLGKDIAGETHFANVAKMPHLLLAGATGAGKSVTIHAIIASLLYRNSPQNLRFILIDPKRVELTLYNNIPHLLTPVITDSKKAILSLKWAAREMERRYDILESHSVRDIASYHKNIFTPSLESYDKDSDEEPPERMPYIVIVIDELADIMQAYPRELESAVVRLAQMSRAVGIHLILSTQRPSVNVITGLIKANIPARMALQVASQIDSRTILDTGGAEKLLGAGDMLYLSGDMSKPLRMQTAFISEAEVKKIVKFLKKNHENDLPNEINFTENQDPNALFSASIDDEDEDEDEYYEEAKEIVIAAGKASTSYLQRKLRIGYSRAARLMDILEERGVIGPADGSKPREILEGYDEEEEEIEEEEE